jgi:hypothetical protein
MVEFPKAPSVEEAMAKRQRAAEQRFSILKVSARRYAVIKLSSWGDATVSLPDGSFVPVPDIAWFGMATRPLSYEEAQQALYFLRAKKELPEGWKPQ